jgi:hypothetical protein
MKAMRTSVHAGLLCITPLALWLLLEAGGSPLPTLAPAALRALVIVQALAIALWIPLLPAAPAREQWQASVMLSLLPAPLGALLWLSDAVSASALLRAQAALLVLALLTCGAARLLVRAPRLAPFLRASLQIVLATLLWHLRPRWLDPLLA